eukprot:3837073-Pleurochrysis_carterae.AAC.1
MTKHDQFHQNAVLGTIRVETDHDDNNNHEDNDKADRSGDSDHHSNRQSAFIFSSGNSNRHSADEACDGLHAVLPHTCPFDKTPRTRTGPLEEAAAGAAADGDDGGDVSDDLAPHSKHTCAEEVVIGSARKEAGQDEEKSKAGRGKRGKR